ncbi:MAG: hypothetical protein AAFR67_01450 [Chloroflexota bacterium]
MGLLTYGHLDVIPDILENIPPRIASVSRLAKLVKVVLSTFELDGSLSIDAPLEVDEIKAWYEQHKDELVWDEDELVLKFQDTQI